MLAKGKTILPERRRLCYNGGKKVVEGERMQKRSKKEVLVRSFQELALQKPISKITITNITDNCGLSQPTFYRYFKDKYDLIAWAYTSAAGEIMGRIGEQGYLWRDTLYDGMRYFDKNRSLAVNALKHTSGRDAFMRQMERINIDLLCNEVRKTIVTERIPDDILDMVKIYCYGTVRLLCDWLTDNAPLPPERLAEIMERSLPEPLKVYLYPYF